MLIGARKMLKRDSDTKALVESRYPSSDVRIYAVKDASVTCKVKVTITSAP